MKNSIFISVVTLSLILLGFTAESLGQDKTYRNISSGELKDLTSEAMEYSFDRGRYETTEDWQQRLESDAFRQKFCIQVELAPKLNYDADAHLFTFLGVHKAQLSFLFDGSPFDRRGRSSLFPFLFEIIRQGNSPLGRNYPEVFKMSPRDAERYEKSLLARLRGCIVSKLGDIVPEEIVVVESRENREIARWRYLNWWTSNPIKE